MTVSRSPLPAPALLPAPGGVPDLESESLSSLTREWPVQRERVPHRRARTQLSASAEWLMAHGARDVRLELSGLDGWETHMSVRWTSGPLLSDLMEHFPHQRLRRNWEQAGRPGDPRSTSSPSRDSRYRGQQGTMVFPLPPSWGGVSGEPEESLWKSSALFRHQIQLVRTTPVFEESLAWLVAYSLQLRTAAADDPQAVVSQIESFTWDQIPEPWWRTQGLGWLTAAPLRLSPQVGSVVPFTSRGEVPRAASPWMVRHQGAPAIAGAFGAVVRRVTTEVRDGTLPQVVSEVIGQHLVLQLDELGSPWSGGSPGTTPVDANAPRRQWLLAMLTDPHGAPSWPSSLIRVALLHPDQQVRMAGLAAQTARTASPATARSLLSPPRPVAIGLDEVPPVPLTPTAPPNVRAR